jgi:predicted phosphate transport protein (TIGR00153 family)
MLDLLMATEPLFPKLFGRSPIAPIQAHMKVAAECAAALGEFMDAALRADWTEAEGLAQKVSGLESDADNIKRDIRQNLPRGLFMPVARSDLLELIQMQDKIANRSKDVAGLMFGRRIEIPDSLQGSFREYVAHAIGAARIAQESLASLDELIEGGFNKRSVDVITNMIKRLDAEEHETDVKQIEVRNHLMAVERDLNPVDVMFLYRMIDLIGDIADYSQTVGNRLLTLIAR